MKKYLIAAALTIAGLLGLGLANAASPIQLGGSIWPLTFATVPVTNLADAFNEMLMLINNQAVSSANPIISGTVNEYGVTFGAAGGGGSFYANPLVQTGYYDVKVASLNAPKGGTSLDDLIIAQASRTIYPQAAGIVLYASGTPATCTNVQLACDGTTNGALFVSQPGGNVIATFPVAALVDKVAVTPFMVASAVSYGSAATRGCPAGEGIIASTGGSACTTNTDMFIQFPYIVQ